MESCSDHIEEYLTEYRTLREEILANQRCQHEIILTTYTLVAAIFALGFGVNEYLFLLSYIILVPLKCKYIFHIEAELKLGTYIKTYIEPKIKGLNWESVTHCKEVDDKIANHSWKISRLSYFIDTILSVTIIISLIIYFKNNGTQFSFYTCPLQMTILVISLLLTAFIFYLDVVMLKRSGKIIKHYESGFRVIDIPPV